jgi:hypothetical protein
VQTICTASAVERSKRSERTSDEWRRTVDKTIIHRNLEYIKLEWADIHHSRQQEWSALVAIGGIFYAFSQVDLSDDQLLWAALFLGIIGMLTAFLGACIAWQHHTILLQKISVIVRLERQIGIQYPTRNVLFPVQVLMYLLFGGICSTFLGIIVGCWMGAIQTDHLRPWPYVVGFAVFVGFFCFALIHRRKAVKAQSYDFAHPFCAEMQVLEPCLASLGEVPLKLIVGGTFDRNGIKEILWEDARWTWSQDDGTITKPILLNRRDRFQFSVANASSKQDWHRHSSIFEVYVSDDPMDVEYEEPDAERGKQAMHVNQGVLIVPPEIPHKVSLSGNTFVFQATLADQDLGEDKVKVREP